MRKNIVLSVAHDVHNQGASWDGCTEYVESGRWTYAAASFLCELGIPAIIVEGDSLPDKIQKVNKIPNVALAMEIHFNACGNCGAAGSETLYYPGSVTGMKYAKAIQNNICDYTGVRNRGIKEGWLRGDKPGVKDYPGDVPGDEVMAGFLKFVKAPALILEPEFIENLTTLRNNRLRACEAIRDAIREVLYAN